MVDLHIHILPGIDDGADSTETALKMAKMAYDDGVTDMIVTPHCNVTGMFENYNSDVFDQYFEAFEENLKKSNIPLKIHRGMEVFANEDIFDLYQTERIITLNDSRYLLVEFGFYENPDWVIYCLENLLSMGIVPIVAHPERYRFVHNYPNIVAHWVSMGCLSQINKGSLLGDFGRLPARVSKRLIDRNLAHFIASDAHSFDGRDPLMSQAYDFVAEKWSKGTAYRLFEENPYKVIGDKTIEGNVSQVIL